MKRLLAFLALIVTSFLLVKTVSADSGCGQYGQYGCPSPSFTILVNKLVDIPNSSLTDPTGATFVDNLSPSDPRFKAGQLVFFKFIVKNTSTTGLTNITVKDTLPSFIEPVSGPGNYDGNSRTITFNAGDFAPNEEKIYYFKMQVDSVQYLPADKGLFCILNRAQAYNDKVSNEDTSQLCIEKVVTGVTNVPSAGPELGLLLLGLNFAGIGTGIFLKRKSI